MIVIVYYHKLARIARGNIDFFQKNAFDLFLHHYFYTFCQFDIIFEIAIPYPFSGEFIKTWVTAPTSFPF